MARDWQNENDGNAGETAALIGEDVECCPECIIPEGALARTLTILNRKGLHARATAKLVQCIDGYNAEVTVGRCGDRVGGTSIMGILTLGAAQGMTITVSAAGAEAEEVLDAIEALIANRFGEEE
ncbi:HPr family phosphocarrier protein [Beijerinckia indica]|uniref:Phosphotransferase system, phosphocarrier protein HPr n=1 Tax=Beijerinckia indica subsp. indica (strain ATCC 9039 / DSM 1715 / NCIMB 8712) TaxID=395963 RepID=B2IJT4_BEII9|nr:HPr family phosphocarrier protein [Beijerinckia indica]ACB96309.1 Phosphotransferase system, phosphocarrier protein HPr [Beijerinckia indica subsp. indica ATCC 9039]